MRLYLDVTSDEYRAWLTEQQPTQSTWYAYRGDERLPTFGWHHSSDASPLARFVASVVNFYSADVCLNAEGNPCADLESGTYHESVYLPIALPDWTLPLVVYYYNARPENRTYGEDVTVPEALADLDHALAALT